MLSLQSLWQQLQAGSTLKTMVQGSDIQRKEPNCQHKENGRAIQMWDNPDLKNEIIKDYEANVSSSIKWSRAAQHEDIDNTLLDLFLKARLKNIPHYWTDAARKGYKNRIRYSLSTRKV